MNAGVSVQSVESRPTAVVVRTTTWAEFPHQWRTMLDEVYAFLRTSDVHQTGHNVMLFHDDVPTVEVGVEVTGTFASRGAVVSSHLPAGETATTIHRGGYDQLEAGHRAVREWCAAHGRVLAGPRWEIYGDWHEDPAQLETEIHYLLD